MENIKVTFEEGDQKSILNLDIDGNEITMKVQFIPKVDGDKKLFSVTLLRILTESITNM